MKSLIPVVLFVVLAAFVGCTQPQDTGMSGNSSGEASEVAATATVNTHCPIMGGEVKPDGGTVEWNGQTVGFCCSGCIEEFQALSDDEKAAALAKADSAHDDHDHGEHDHGEEGDAHDHGQHEEGSGTTS